ncbi:MAG: hydantoinase/oxoprolinase family protein [Chloroflexi bacterium]|nr:hydantoinase/oxoprolinase family protein [Chloroflexota bacterium]
MGLRLGVDIGGTFTDLATVDEETGEQRVWKVPSTPEDYSSAVIQAIKTLSIDQGVAPDGMSFLSHATTIVTNAILESKGARAALITTRGFRDVLEIRRQSRAKLYDIFQPSPKVLIPRHLRLEVTERIDAYGQVNQPLKDEELPAIVSFLKAHQVQAVAVCLLFSFLNPVHEKAVGALLRRELPDVKVFLSSEVLPEMREYERTSTVAVCAYVAPVLEGYLNQLNGFLKSDSYPPLYLTGSSGGVFSVEEGLRMPAMLTESGPAAGVTAAAALGELLGLKQLISFDMGGTTAKTSLINDGEVSITTEYEVGGMGNVRRWLQGTGHPIKVPVVDLAEVSAGGGSIAWVDDAGGLRVGPQSAGASPGPACYGMGGEDPTVTDADTVLGYLDPDHFLGGKMTIFPDRASQAIQESVGDPLGLNLLDAAQGIVDIVNSNMADAVRMVSIERGHDPREFTLVAFGGAGPVHAGKLASELGITRVVIPPNPGAFSAMGLVCTDLKRDYVRTLYTAFVEEARGPIREAYSEVEAEAREMLTRSDIQEEKRSFRYSMDLRYEYQAYELSVPVGASEIEDGSLAGIAQRFHDQHMTMYGYNAPDEPIQLVNLRVTAIGQLGGNYIAQKATSSNASMDQARTAYREVFFKETGKTRCPIYDRGALPIGTPVPGPAVIQEANSTIVVYPGQSARATEWGTIELTLAG